MAQRTMERNAKRGAERAMEGAQRTTERLLDEVKQAEHNMVEHWMDYARENPGNAAIMCLCVGFVLGWKLKPW